MGRLQGKRSYWFSGVTSSASCARTREPGAGGLGPADAASLHTAVHLGPVEAKHLPPNMYTFIIIIIIIIILYCD